MRRKLPHIGPEHRHEPTTEECGSDVVEAVFGSRRRSAEVELRVLPQDRAVQLLEAAARIDAELVHEHTARVVVGLKGLRLTPGAVEREHQLTPKTLAERVLFDEQIELADELAVRASLELGLDPLFDRCQAQVLEPADLGLRKGVEREFGERLSAPE